MWNLFLWCFRLVLWVRVCVSASLAIISFVQVVHLTTTSRYLILCFIVPSHICSDLPHLLGHCGRTVVSTCWPVQKTWHQTQKSHDERLIVKCNTGLWQFLASVCLVGVIMVFFPIVNYDDTSFWLPICVMKLLFDFHVMLQPSMYYGWCSDKFTIQMWKISQTWT
jgi:hypothetical protein